MPTIDTIVPEVTKQAIEVISEQIINRLIDVLGFSNLFKNNDNLFIKSDDLRSSNFDDSNHNKRTQNNRCDVTIVPDYDPFDTAFSMINGRSLDSHLQAKRWQLGEYPVFNDSRSDVKLYEVALPTSVELQFAVRLKSIELSDAFNVALFSKALTGGTVYDYNDVQFSYGVPDTILILLYKIYKMQSDLHATISFQEYLSYCSNSSIIPLVNRDRLDGDKELIVQRTNVRVMGKMDYAGDKHDTEDFNKVSNRYVIEFKYTYQFAKPCILRINYPIMINNKQIEGQYIGKPKEMFYGEGDKFFGEYAINNYFLRHNQAQINLNKTYPHVQHPFYDDWTRSPAMYKDIVTKYQTLFTGLLSVDIDPVNGSLSLNADFKKVFKLLKPEIGAEIEKVLRKFNLDREMFLTFNDHFRRLGIFDIAVFSNDKMIPFDKLSLSDELILNVNCKLRISKIYRLVISQIRDIRILNREYVYYMLENPEYYSDFLAFHMKYLVEYNYVKVITSKYNLETDVVVQPRGAQTSYWDKLPSRALILSNYVVEICKNK